VVVTGGAKCLATNGIHQLSLACRLFDDFPTKVIADIRNDSINPRSADLSFLEGTAVFSFPTNKFISINFSNSSRVQLKSKLVFEFGYIEMVGTSVDVYRIPKDSFEVQVGKTKTFYSKKVLEDFNIFHETNGLDGMKEIYDSISLRKYQPDFAFGNKVTEALFVMLVANLECSKVTLPLSETLENKYWNHDWKIS
jgi:hypothetical protein